MEKDYDKVVKEATSNIDVENKKLKSNDLKIIKQALQENEKSFIKNLYDRLTENGKNKRK